MNNSNPEYLFCVQKKRIEYELEKWKSQVRKGYRKEFDRKHGLRDRRMSEAEFKNEFGKQFEEEFETIFEQTGGNSFGDYCIIMEKGCIGFTSFGGEESPGTFIVSCANCNIPLLFPEKTRQILKEMK